MRNAILTATAACACSLAALATPLRIMPLGDSITAGAGWDGGGYRAVLREKLVAAGYDVDYVGTQGGNYGTLIDSGDWQHEGHGGWKVQDLVDYFGAWSMNIDAPNVILLKIGTNNFTQDQDLVMAQTCALLDDIKRIQPSAHVIVATLISIMNDMNGTLGDWDAWVREHNARLAAEIASRAANGDKVSLVDMYSAVPIPSGYNDIVHPNETGYRAMADAWFTAITNLYPDPATAGGPCDMAVAYPNLDKDNGQLFAIGFNQQLGEGADVLANYVSTSPYFQPTSVTVDGGRRYIQLRTTNTMYGDTFKIVFGDIKNLAGDRSLQGVELEVTYVDKELLVTSIDDDFAAKTLTLHFNTPVGEGAGDLANYTSADETLFHPTSVTVAANKLSVVVKSDVAVVDAPFTLRLSDIQKATGTKTIAETPIAWRFAPYGAAYRVPEAALYEKVYALDIPNQPNYAYNAPAYAVDRHAEVGPFSRIAYYLELVADDGTMQYVWASMDAFTGDASKIAIPTLASGAIFQQRVSNLNVWSNVDGVPTGTGRNGNIEFCPYNYGSARTLGLELASDAVYDADDTFADNGTYSCMQIHDSDTATPLLCYNGWGGGSCQLGIGRDTTGGQPDWTTHETLADWSKHRRLEVYVMASIEQTPAPQLVSAALSSSGREIVATFDLPVADSPAAAAFRLSDGTAVSKAVRLAGNSRVVTLTTGEVKWTDGLALTAIAVASDSPSRSYAPTTVAVTPPPVPEVDPLAPPEQVTSRVAAAQDYQLLYTLRFFKFMSALTGNPLGLNLGGNGWNDIHEVDNSKLIGGFDRVGFLMELVPADDPSTTNWVWTAFDAFSANPADYDIPTPTCKNVRRVGNMDVDSNVDGIVTGAGITTGNIEFWPYNYGGGPGLEGLGGDNGKFDYNDSFVEDGSWGCMQVHNYGAQQTLWSATLLNAGGFPGVGIGNNPDQSAQPDYTMGNNVEQYASVKLYVLVRPDPTATVPKFYNPQRAVSSPDRRQVVLTCEAFVDASVVDPELFAVNGLAPTAVRLSANNPHALVLDLAEPLAPASTATITTRFAYGSNLTNASFVTPNEVWEDVASVDEYGDYMEVSELSVDTGYNSSLAVPYHADRWSSLDDLVFDRIAYSLELESNEGVRQWVWVSMDAYTDDLSKLGFPSVTRDIFFWQFVENLKVRASANANVVSGEWSRGNIEITPSNYGGGNVLNIPNADGWWDFGNDPAGGNGTTVGYGCFKVNNFNESQTVIGASKLGGNGGVVLIIGNNTVDPASYGLDGTMAAATTGNYAIRRLRAYVRPLSVSGDCGLGPQFLLQPVSVKIARDETDVVMTAYAPGAVRYQWRKNGVPMAGMTGSVLVATMARSEKSAVFDVIAYLDASNYTLSEPATAIRKGGYSLILR